MRMIDGNRYLHSIFHTGINTCSFMQLPFLVILFIIDRYLPICPSWPMASACSCSAPPAHHCPWTSPQWSWTGRTKATHHILSSQTPAPNPRQRGRLLLHSITNRDIIAVLLHQQREIKTALLQKDREHYYSHTEKDILLLHSYRI